MPPLCAPCAQSGGMMVEMLLTLALAAVMLPFVVNFQKNRIERAQNIAITNQMQELRNALERYIDLNKADLMTTIGRSVVRVKLSDLDAYGAPSAAIGKQGDKIQVRILKSSDQGGRATLQGIIVLNDSAVTPMRTREIINMGGGQFGFIEGNHAYGAFGIWRANAIDFGISAGRGDIVGTTRPRADGEQYLWRAPSESAADATMQSNLNLAGHDIVNAKFFDAMSARFDESLKSDTIAADKMIFQNMTTLDKNFQTAEALVAGTLSADSKNMEVSGTLTLTDTAKLTNFTADDLWVMNLNLSDLNISSAGLEPAILNVNQSIDMVGGNITASLVTVGFTGSVTPKLVVKNRIEDPSNSGYYWDLDAGEANLSDASFAELNRMGTLAAQNESGAGTASRQLFAPVSANKNATAADFMNAISEIQKRVSAKFRKLNLQQ